MRGTIPGSTFLGVLLAVVSLLCSSTGFAQAVKKGEIIEPFTANSNPRMDVLWSYGGGSAGTAVMTSPPAGSGFRWAARHFIAKTYAEDPDWKTRYTIATDEGVLRTLYGWPGGSYFFTIFNATHPAASGYDADQYVDLSAASPQAKIVVKISKSMHANTLEKGVIRHMIRVRSGADRLWYASTPIDLSTYPDQDAKTVETAVAATQWYAADAKSNAQLNNLLGNYNTPPNQWAEAKPPLQTEKNVLTWSAEPTTPPTLEVDGGGLYSQSGHDGSTGGQPNSTIGIEVDSITWTS